MNRACSAARRVWRAGRDRFSALALEEVYRRRRKSESPGIYLIGTPEHTNLGDHAIALGERLLLSSVFPAGTAVHEIHTDRLRAHLGPMRRHLHPDDLLLIHGGGFMGVEWFEGEALLRSVVSSFPAHRVLVFPQTIYYESSPRGKEEFARSMKLYAAHPHLHLFAREQTSLEIMRQAYPHNRAGLAPDMALLLPGMEPSSAREGVLLCLRGDAERRISTGERANLLILAENLGQGVACTDMLAQGVRRITAARRQELVEEKLRMFARARLVVTDRLHGMIFSALAGTPCIALPNYNHKVEGVFRWLEALGYLRFAESPRQIPPLADELLQMPGCRYEPSGILPAFQPLIQAVRCQRPWSAAPNLAKGPGAL